MDYDVKGELHRSVKEGKWDKVIKMYQTYPSARKARISRAGDTAFHIAVSDGNVLVVTRLVKMMMENEGKAALQTQNHVMNTALHIAASKGDHRMCQIIASVDPSLVDDRNAHGETPIFLAALYGRKNAFLCLHYIRNPSLASTNYANCRRNNGDTILHSAIAGDHFDLGFQIIHLYKELAVSFNQDGLSPLHLLASKPSAFKSGSPLDGIETILYNCIYVEKLEVADQPTYEPQTLTELYDSYHLNYSDNYYPDNYRTCCNVFHYMKACVAVIGRHRYKAGDDLDERPNRRIRRRGSRVPGSRAGNLLLPANCRTCFDLIKFYLYPGFLIILWLLGKGSDLLKKIRRMKEKHTYSIQIVKELFHYASFYEYENNGCRPHRFEDFNMTQETSLPRPFALCMPDEEGEQHSKRRTKKTPILVAATNGVMEIIEKFLEFFPMAIDDVNEDNKNIVLLAVEHRQPQVYELLLKKEFYIERAFQQVDHKGNSALHLAATLGDYMPWFITGEALQMQWELKLFTFVKDSMPPGFFRQYNHEYETPSEIFTKTHKELVKRGGEWLNKTAESCSVVAALIATVAFATAATVPGGVDANSGNPTLRDEPTFQVFAISSFIALCCSVMAVVMFLALLTSRFQEQDFYSDLPKKLLLGLTLLFMSITSMMVSFCAGHFFVLKHHLQDAAFPIYLVTCIFMTIFVFAQFPFYFDFFLSTLMRAPRSYKTRSLH